MSNAATVSFSDRFAAVHNRNFRLYFVGQSLSLIGSFVQIIGQGWLVLQLSDSGATLGVVTALQFLPLLVLGTWGGVLADRFDNRLLLLAASCASLVCAAGIGFLVATGRATVWWVGGFALALGLVGPFERPAAQAFLYELAGADDVANAVALNSLLAPLSRLIGPAIAGVLIAKVGIAACFFVNAGSFLFVAAALLAIRRADMHSRRQFERSKGQLREGLRYARRSPVISSTLIVLFISGTLAYNFQVTAPAMTKFVFHGGASQLALSQVLSASGAVFAGIAVAGIRRPDTRHMATAGVAFGVALLMWGLMPTFLSWALFGSVVGITSTAFTTLVQSVLQRATEPRMLGRVMGLFSIGFFGTTPIGALICGVLISALSPRWPFYVGGVATILVAGAVALSPAARRTPARLPAPTPTPASLPVPASSESVAPEAT